MRKNNIKSNKQSSGKSFIKGIIFTLLGFFLIGVLVSALTFVSDNIMLIPQVNTTTLNATNIYAQNINATNKAFFNTLQITTKLNFTDRESGAVIQAVGSNGLIELIAENITKRPSIQWVSNNSFDMMDFQCHEIDYATGLTHNHCKIYTANMTNSNSTLLGRLAVGFGSNLVDVTWTNIDQFIIGGNLTMNDNPITDVTRLTASNITIKENSTLNDVYITGDIDADTKNFFYDSTNNKLLLTDGTLKTPRTLFTLSRENNPTITLNSEDGALTSDEIQGQIVTYNSDATANGPQNTSFIQTRTFGSTGYGGYLVFGATDGSTDGEGTQPRSIMYIYMISSNKNLVNVTGDVSAEGFEVNRTRGFTGTCADGTSLTVKGGIITACS